MQTSRKQVFDEINITPLTDIFLVLLITMMVVAPMVSSMRQDVKPPEIQSGTQVEQHRLTVEITPDGAFYLQGQPVAEAQLADALRQQSETMKAQVEADQQSTEAQPFEKNVVIRADKAVKSGVVMKVFQAAKDAEFNKVTIAGEPLSAERRGQLQQQTPAETGEPL